MSKYITLEDINTWLLKYGELDAPKYNMPHVNITGVLYKGNTNVLEDIISLPSGVEYTVYFENRPVTSVSLPRDYGDECILRIVTKSSYPYVNSDVRVSVPVEVKHLTSLEDLNNYDYGYIDTLSDVEGVISNDISIVLEDEALFDDCNLTFEADVTMTGDLTIQDSLITNNNVLTFDNVNFNITTAGKDYIIINNDNLTIKGCEVESTLPFILNKDTLTLQGNNINVLCESVPFIYSNTGDYTITNNNVEYSSTLEYEDFGVCFIRTNTINPDKLIRENSFNYPDVSVSIDQVSYIVSGEGLCYCGLDDDRIMVRELEVV